MTMRAYNGGRFPPLIRFVKDQRTASRFTAPPLALTAFARWYGWRPRLRTTRPNGSNDEAPSIWLHQRAAALVQRTEGLVARHGGEQLVKVPLTLGLRRLLHLEQVHVMHHAAVDADLAVLGEEVVDRGGAHLLHDLRCLVSAGHVADLLVKTL